MLTNSEIGNRIDETIHSKRDRGILKRVLIDGETYERTAEEFEVHRNTIYNVMRRHRGIAD